MWVHFQLVGSFPPWGYSGNSGSFHLLIPPSPGASEFSASGLSASSELQAADDTIHSYILAVGMSHMEKSEMYL